MLAIDRLFTQEMLLTNEATHFFKKWRLSNQLDELESVFSCGFLRARM